MDCISFRGETPSCWRSMCASISDASWAFNCHDCCRDFVEIDLALSTLRGALNGALPVRNPSKKQTIGCVTSLAKSLLDTLESMARIRTQYVPVSDLKFTHVSIGKKFGHGTHRGRPLEILVGELEDGLVRSDADSLRLDAVLYHGRIRSLNNRRLWCLQEFQRRRPEVPVHAHVRVHPLLPGTRDSHGDDMLQKFLGANDSNNNGETVRVRSGSSTFSRASSRCSSGARSPCSDFRVDHRSRASLKNTHSSSGPFTYSHPVCGNSWKRDSRHRSRVRYQRQQSSERVQVFDEHESPFENRPPDTQDQHSPGEHTLTLEGSSLSAAHADTKESASMIIPMTSTAVEPCVTYSTQLEEPVWLQPILSNQQMRKKHMRSIRWAAESWLALHDSAGRDGWGARRISQEGRQALNLALRSGDRQATAVLITHLLRLANGRKLLNAKFKLFKRESLRKAITSSGDIDTLLDELLSANFHYP